MNLKFWKQNAQDKRKPSFVARMHRPNLTLWISIFAIVTFFVWASESEIDQITRAQGEVISSARTQIIQSLDGGVIKDILVLQGDVVKKGQVLVVFDKTKIEAAYLETRAKKVALAATSARLKAEIYGGKPEFLPEIVNYPQFKFNQLALFQKRQNAINQEVSALTEMLGLANKELKMNEPLILKGDVSLADVLKLQRQVADLKAQIENKKNKYFQDAEAELSKTEEDLASTQQLLSQKKDMLDRVELVAPMDGIVKNVKITTLGGVVRPSEEVMEIVPDEDNLVIEAKVKSSDIAFLKKGLPANVKIDAYDYTIYGSLKGNLIYISPDTLTDNLKQNEQPYYRLQVKTEGRRFSGRPNQKLEIQTGMTASVEIKTGHNTVLKYLIKPVVKTISESLGER